MDNPLTIREKDMLGGTRQTGETKGGDTQNWEQEFIKVIFRKKINK